MNMGTILLLAGLILSLFFVFGLWLKEQKNKGAK